MSDKPYSGKPRTWWIDPTPDNAEELADELDTAVYIAMDKHPGQGPLQWQSSLINVVEYSEVERLQKRLEALREALIAGTKGSCECTWSINKQALRQDDLAKENEG